MNAKRECEPCGLDTYSTKVNSRQFSKCMANEHTSSIRQTRKRDCRSCGPGGIIELRGICGTRQVCKCCQLGTTSKEACRRHVNLVRTAVRPEAAAATNARRADQGRMSWKPVPLRLFGVDAGSALSERLQRQRAIMNARPFRKDL